jgi:hypothetical protein
VPNKMQGPAIVALNSLVKTVDDVLKTYEVHWRSV